MAPTSIERFFQFGLLGMACSSFCALASSGFVAVPDICAVSALLLLRGLILCDIIRVPAPSRALSLGVFLALAFFAFDLLELSRSLVSSTAHLMFFLLALKQLTGLSRRDAAYIALFSFVCLIAAAILSINTGFIFFLALYLVFALAALTSSEIRRADNRAGLTARVGTTGFAARLATLSVVLATGILILTAGLFFLLPRTAEAALSRLVPLHRVFMTGFSNRVSLGEVGRIAQDTTPVMHINAPRPELLSGLKWRGAALTNFDGRLWTTGPTNWRPVEVDDQQSSFGPPRQPQHNRFIGYEVTLDAPGFYLFFAGSPVVIRSTDTAIEYSDLGAFRLFHRVPAGFRYEVYSQVEDPPESVAPFSPPPELDIRSREQCLHLPAHIDPRIATLAHQLSDGATGDLAKVRAVERGLRGRYAYSLETPTIPPTDPLADFLFVRRKGYCEYFASAMAVMLRQLDIPARLATGFQGGVFNTVTGLWVVRASSAHAWVEAWIPGHGWTTFDPTPASPASQSSIFDKLNLYVDAAGAFWREWVIAYDPLHQGTLASQVLHGVRGVLGEWPGSAWDTVSHNIAANSGRIRDWGMGVLALAIAAGTLWYVGPSLFAAIRLRLRFQRVRRGGKASADDAALLYQRMLQIVKRRGYQKPPWFTPAEFAASLPGEAFGVTVRNFTDAYNEFRYGRRDAAAGRMSELLAELEKTG